MRTTRIALPVIILSVLNPHVADRAEASGFLVARFGGEHGHAASDSPTTMYYNPAGIALGRGWRFYAEGIFAYRSATYSRPASAIDNVVGVGESGTGTPAEAISANSGTATLGDPLVMPFVGVATDLGVPNLGVGVSFYVPFGGSASWDRNEAFANSTEYPGAVDGVNRWATIEGSIKSSYVTLAGAYRWPMIGLSVGVGLNLVLSDVHTVRARNADGTDHLVTSSGQIIEGRSLIDASGTTFSLGAGVIWEPRRDVWIGLSYQSQPGFGRMTMEGELTNKFGTSPAATSDVKVEQDLPDLFRIAARWRATPRVELRLFGDYVRWSRFERQCIVEADGNCALTETGAPAMGAQGVAGNLPRNWHDAFGVRAGGSYWFRSDLEAFVGAGYDSNAIPDETLEASFIDMDKISGAIGARMRVLDGRMTIATTLNHIFYLDRTVDQRDRDMDGDPISPYDAPSRVPDGAGTYTHSVTALNVGVEYSF